MLMKSVLVADDNAFILETIAARIRDDEIDVITARNGRHAVDKAKVVHPDLAILDVSMPVMNGLDAATRLHEMMPRLPIILFTSFRWRFKKEDRNQETPMLTFARPPWFGS